jgi:hypothetical protein
MRKEMKLFACLFVAAILLLPPASIFGGAAPTVEEGNGEDEQVARQDEKIWDNDIPTWCIGNEWNYEIDASMDISMPVGTLTVDVEIEQGKMKVERIVDFGKNIAYEIAVMGNFTGTYWILGYSGEMEGSITGRLYADLSDLSVSNMSSWISGRIEIEEEWHDFQINMITTFDPLLEFFDFPLLINDLWIIHSTISTTGYINIEGISNQSISESYDMKEDFEGFGRENVSVPAGNFDSFKFGTGSLKAWYSPAAENLVKMKIKDFHNDITIHHLFMNLTSYSLLTQPIDITENIIPTSCYPGEKVVISGIATNSTSGDPIIAGDVVAMLAGEKNTTTTNATGGYSVTLTAPSHCDPTPSPNETGSFGIVVKVTKESSYGYQVKTLTVLIPFIIQKPKGGYFYFLNWEIIQTPFEKAIIIGAINVEVEGYVPINKVEFYVDDVLKYKDNDPPYEWLWDETIFFRHTLKVVAHYDGVEASEELQVIIFNI